MSFYLICPSELSTTMASNLHQWASHSQFLSSMIFTTRNNPAHLVFLYQNVEGKLSRLTSHVGPAAHTAARVVARRANLDLGGDDPRPTVTILAATGHIVYIPFAEKSLMKRYERYYHISYSSEAWNASSGDHGICSVLRNSRPAVAHLLSKVVTSNVLVSPGAPIQVWREAIQSLGNGAKTVVLSTLVFEDMFMPGVVFVLFHHAAEIYQLQDHHALTRSIQVFCIIQVSYTEWNRVDLVLEARCLER